MRATTYLPAVPLKCLHSVCLFSQRQDETGCLGWGVVGWVAGLLHYMGGFQAFFSGAVILKHHLATYKRNQVVSYVCVHVLDKYIAMRHNV